MNILIVAAHPDDEVLGCGGTILKHSNAGDKVSIVTLTNGVDSRDNKTSLDNEKRNKSAIKAMKILGAEWIGAGKFPDNNMGSSSLLEIVKFIESFKKDINPDIIYTHSHSDLNIDHRVVCEATITAFRPLPQEEFSEIRLFETPSSTDFSVDSLYGSFKPNLFVDITEYWLKKVEALNCYDVEMVKYPHSRSYNKIKSMAEFRGASSGLELAESFEVVRKIVR